MTPVLRLDGRLRFFDPLSPPICEESPKSPPCIVLEHLRSVAEAGLFGLTGSSYFEWTGPQRDVDILAVVTPDVIEEVVQRVVARTDPLSLREALKVAHERGYKRLSLEVLERIAASVSLRKVLGYRVFIRYLDTPLWRYRPCECETVKLGSATVWGRVIGANRSFVFPYEYLVEVYRSSAEVLQGKKIRVVSLRAMFAELASEGWLVEVRGDLEAKVCGKSVELQVFLWSKDHGITALRRG